MSMQIQPLNDRVIVERKEDVQKTTSTIVIPETAKEKPSEGVIAAVGPGKCLDNGERVHPSVKVGDRILYGKYAGTEVKVNGKEYIVMREDDIIGIIKA